VISVLSSREVSRSIVHPDVACEYFHFLPKCFVRLTNSVPRIIQKSSFESLIKLLRTNHFINSFYATSPLQSYSLKPECYVNRIVKKVSTL
jgi:hypothetical protein